MPFAPGRISVVIPSYESHHLVEVCHAVKALNPLEILVADSSPVPPESVDPLVRILRSDTRVPAGAARNRGAREASGEFLLFIDSDVVLTDNAIDFVRQSVAAASETSDRVVSGIYTAEGPAGFFSRLQNRILRYRLTDGSDPALPLFSSSHFLIRRSTFKSLAGFNEAISTYEDVEFLARCSKLGVRCESSPEFEAVHLKAYSGPGLVKDYFQKAFNAFQVRRRYAQVFKGVPSMMGRDLSLALLCGLSVWVALVVAALVALPAVFASVIALALIVSPYRSARRVLRGETRTAVAASLLWWPVMAAAIAVAIVASALSWAAQRVEHLFYFASDMLRALSRVLIRNGLPVQIIAYVTARCNLRCEHCFYKETLDAPNPGELPLDVFDRTTKDIGPVLWFSLAGGEPFIRKDLGKLIELVQANCRPKVFSFPTNGWYTEQTYETSLRVLQKMQTGNLILFFSLDGPRDIHDAIRGKGSFDRVRETMARLRPLTEIYPNLYLNVITTVTDQNADVAAQFIDELVGDFRPSAISINLFRYHSLEHPRVADRVIDGYKAAVDSYSKYLRLGALKHYGFVGGRILLFKEILQKELIYRVAKFNEFVTPCTAGTLSYVIMEDGRVTPCEILPDTIGNITAPGTFRAMVTNDKARKLRTWISETNCKCTYECAMSTNTLFSWPMSKRMIRSLLGDLVFGRAS